MNVLRYFPNQALNFAIKDKMKALINPYNKKTEPRKFLLGNMLAGGTAGSLSMIIVYPLDVARQRMGMDVSTKGDRQYKGLVDCVKKISAREGFIKAFYPGLTVSIVGLFQYRAFYFGVFDTYKDQCQHPLKMFALAQSATMMATGVGYPMDTLRRRLMMMGGEKEKMYNGMVDCFKKILKNEGIGSFYKGFVPNIFRSVGAALVLVFYETMNKKINE